MATYDTAGNNPWAQLRIRLRGELCITPRHATQPGVWIMEDRLRQKFFEIGSAERQFLAALDGQQTVAEVVARLASVDDEPPLDLPAACIVIRWLVEQELVQVLDAQGSPWRLPPWRSSSGAKTWNPLGFELASFDPSSWLVAGLPLARWAWSTGGALIWCGLVGGALVKLITNLSAWKDVPTQVFDPGNWLRLTLVWAGLKCLHELGHALASLRYGVPIRRAGIQLLLGAPVAFVDVTACWRLPSRWQRFVIAASGMLVELAVASVALWSWTPGSSTLGDRLCIDIALLAGGQTLLFNLNPLLRFDGYFMLVDLLGITNLAARAQRQLTRLKEHWLSGRESSALDEPMPFHAGLLLYGLLAALWRTAMLFTIVLGLVAKWAWWGAGLSLVLAWFWCGGSRKRGDLPASVGRATLAARRRRAVAIASLGLLLGASGAWLLTAARIEAPAIVEYAPLTILRADAAGFVESVAVDSGTNVEPGTILMTIRNAERILELQRITIEREQCLLQARLHLQLHELSQHQTLQARLTELDERQRELQQQCDALTVRAPRRGTVIGRDLEALVGRYVHQGDALLALGDDDAKELLVSVAVADEREFVEQLAQPLDVVRPASWSRPRRGTLALVEPRARHELPHEALGAQGGGAVVVRRAAETTAGESAVRFRTLEPRLIARVALDGPTSRSLRAGERVSVVFAAHEQNSLERYLARCRGYLNQLTHTTALDR